MEQFSEEHSKALLSKEWLVKIDSQSSTPYLFKFYSSTVDLSCCLLVTDTKHTWFEVLNSNHIARRWRVSNPDPSSIFDSADEDAWRTEILTLLSSAHTLGGIADLSFEVIETKYADFAFELECDTFKWRWESVFVGYKASAEILSKHLIMPLISVNHLAFSSSEPAGEISAGDLEKAVDKVGRIARRTADTHVKNALSKPRVATTLRRMTAMFNFTPDLPAIILETEKPELRVQVQQLSPMEKSGAPLENRNLSKMRSLSPDPAAERSNFKDTKSSDVKPSESPNRAINADSATESEHEEIPSLATISKGKEKVSRSPSAIAGNGQLERQSVGPSVPVATSPRPRRSKVSPSDSDSSSLRPPAKKPKPKGSSDDDDSEEERKKHIAQLKSGAGAKRGTRQPIKRGRRF